MSQTVLLWNTRNVYRSDAYTGGGNITEQGKDLGNTKYKPNSVLFYKVKPETTPSLNRGYTTNSQNLVSETEEA